MFGMSWADTLRIVLMGIFILVCIFLTIVVLMQESKQNGLSGAISGAADTCLLYTSPSPRDRG